MGNTLSEEKKLFLDWSAYSDWLVLDSLKYLH